MLSKKYITIIALSAALLLPLQAKSEGNFWGDTVDYDVHNVQPPSATQFGQSSGYLNYGYASEEKETRTVKGIEILGNNIIETSEILDQITVKPGQPFSKSDVQQSLKQIYQTGYFTEQMKAVPVNNSDGTVTLKFIVNENAPVTDFTIEGNTVISTDEILGYLMSMKGKPQNINELNEAISKIQDCYSERGYLLSRIESVSDDPDGTINISIKEGTINRIMISGNEKTKDYVIERNILTEPGSIYNENILKEDLVRLYATQAFKDVTREIEPTDDPDKYDITINVEEQRTATVSVGGGLDSVTGVFASVGLADNNFLGRGERISLNGIAGTGIILNDSSMLRRMNIQAELSYFKPYFYNADTSLLSKIFYRDFGSYQIPLAIERRIGADVTVAHRMKFNKNVTSTLTLGLENINVSEGDKNKIANLYSRYNIPIRERANQLEGGLFLSLSPGIVYDTRDSSVVTRRGTLANLRFDEEFGVLDFQKTHGKLSGMIKHYIPVGKKSSLSLTAKGGGKIHGDNMPEVMAYRVGGAYSVRGFKMSGVGTGDGFVMGSAELAVPIPFMDRTRINFLNNMRFTMWADAGQIFNQKITDRIYDRPGYAVSAGVGLKIYIPGMGPLSIDYGFPITNPGDNGSRAGYFTFGAGDMMY
ncbi:BamA/TamA family outer membrane protein [bacterium]|nr:BamA/TamA family outer membrane protein [bacterium]